MALKQMIKKIEDARKAYEKAKKAVGKDVSKEIGALLGPLIPKGYEFYWTQYTPYFNDGEACTFSVNEPYLRRVVEEDSEDEDMDLGTAIHKYGTADKQETYETDDYSRPLPHGPNTYTRYVKKTVEYTSHGFPEVEGYSKKNLKALKEAWETFPRDFLESAFGDHVKVVVTTEGKCKIDEYEHD